nr:proline-rich protein 36-like [Penaeus vannamei]
MVLVLARYVPYCDAGPGGQSVPSGSISLCLSQVPAGHTKGRSLVPVTREAFPCPRTSSTGLRAIEWLHSVPRTVPSGLSAHIQGTVPAGTFASPQVPPPIDSSSSLPGPRCGRIARGYAYSAGLFLSGSSAHTKGSRPQVPVPLRLTTRGSLPQDLSPGPSPSTKATVSLSSGLFPTRVPRPAITKAHPSGPRSLFGPLAKAPLAGPSRPYQGNSPRTLFRPGPSPISKAILSAGPHGPYYSKPEVPSALTKGSSPGPLPPGPIGPYQSSLLSVPRLYQRALSPRTRAFPHGPLATVSAVGTPRRTLFRRHPVPAVGRIRKRSSPGVRSAHSQGHLDPLMDVFPKSRGPIAPRNVSPRCPVCPYLAGRTFPPGPLSVHPPGCLGQYQNWRLRLSQDASVVSVVQGPPVPRQIPSAPYLRNHPPSASTTGSIPEGTVPRFPGSRIYSKASPRTLFPPGVPAFRPFTKAPPPGLSSPRVPRSHTIGAASPRSRRQPIRGYYLPKDPSSPKLSLAPPIPRLPSQVPRPIPKARPPQVPITVIVEPKLASGPRSSPIRKGTAGLPSDISHGIPAPYLRLSRSQGPFAGPKYQGTAFTQGPLLPGFHKSIYQASPRIPPGPLSRQVPSAHTQKAPPQDLFSPGLCGPITKVAVIPQEPSCFLPRSLAHTEEWMQPPPRTSSPRSPRPHTTGTPSDDLCRRVRSLRPYYAKAQRSLQGPCRVRNYQGSSFPGYPAPYQAQPCPQGRLPQVPRAISKVTPSRSARSLYEGSASSDHLPRSFGSIS